MKKIKIIIESKEKPSVKSVKYYFHTIILDAMKFEPNYEKVQMKSNPGVARIVLKQTYGFDPDTNSQDKQFFYEAFLIEGVEGVEDMKGCGGWIKHPGNGRRYTKYEAIEDALTSCKAYVDDEGVEKPTRPGEPGTLGSVTMRNRSRQWAKQPHPEIALPAWAKKWAKKWAK